MPKAHDLLKKLNLTEKIGLLSQNLYGWRLVEKNGENINKKFLYDEMKKYGVIGSIYGLLRSDPWSKMDFNNGIPANKSSAFIEKVSDEVKGKYSIRPFIVEEASHGHQALDSIIYPVNLASGCSFNVNLYKKMYKNISCELLYKGVNVALVSSLDLALDPRWGRTEECYGEDTFLSMQFTKGLVQVFKCNKNIGVVLKHFIGQGSALGGHNGGSVSMGPNELSIHNLSIAEVGIKNGAIGVMAAYNNIDGIPCHVNSDLLKKWLKEKNKFNGFVMSDGCAIDNLPNLLNISEEKAIAMSIKAGIDIDLWNKSFNKLNSSIKQGLIDEKTIDKSVLRVLKVKERLGLLDAEKPTINLNAKDYSQFNKTSYDMASESLVLLKNNKILPLKNLKNTCLISPLGDNIYHMLGDYTPFIDTKKYNNLFEEFNIPHSLGCSLRSAEEEKIKEAVKLAESHKNVILILGSSSARDFSVKFDENGSARSSSNMMDCGEGMDVAEVKISSSQQKLFDEIYKVNKNIITIIVSGRAIGIERIAEKSKAIIYGFYGGTQQPKAIKDTVLGKNNPSGRLSVSIPINSAQLPVYYWNTYNHEYVDQKHAPLFKFGEGLSYSDFKITNVRSKKINKNHFLFVDVKNTSNMDGKKTILVFGKLKECNQIPPEEILVGFDKKEIKSSETKVFKIKIELSWLKESYKFKDIKFTVK